jgi:succinate dehydrogenase / fumarate reductase membrane anchor subunit
MNPRYRTALGRARGLGSAKEGVHHWWIERLTGLALVPLSLWFIVSVLGLLGAEYGTVRTWLSSPLTLGLMILTIAATFYHAQLGLQVVLEDYIKTKGVRLAAIALVDVACLLLALAAMLAVLFVAFGD